MAKLKSVELTMITGVPVFVPMDIFNLGGVPESVDSVIGNYIKGTRAPLLEVNDKEDMTGVTFYVNPKMIVNVKPKYE